MDDINMLKDDSKNVLCINDLNVSINNKKIINDVSFSLKEGEILVIIGPNGSGKSTLAKALTGFPGLNVSGEVKFFDEDLLGLSATDRSKKGLFMSFQHPVEIEGVTVSNFIRTAINARKPKNESVDIKQFIVALKKAMSDLKIPADFAGRCLNHNFSGGEKKKAEMLQLLMLEPSVAILDETDSGLDLDALKDVCVSIADLKKIRPSTSLIIITHYKKLLDYLSPDRVLVMMGGEIIKSGGAELISIIEEKGFEEFRK